MNGKTSKARFILFAGLLIVITALPTNPAAAKEPITYDFNKSLQDWNVQTDDSQPAYSLELQRDVSPLGCAPEGCIANGYANLKFSPSAAGVGAWIYLKVSSVPDNGREDVIVSFDAKNTGSGKMCALVAYADAHGPESASQFSEVISPKGPALDNNWQTYTFKTQVKTIEKGLIYIAVGLRSIPEMLNASDSATASIGFDNVTITNFQSP